MINLKNMLLITATAVISTATYAHYPYVAPLSYQTFNHHTAILSGFYDNPFASEVAIKNFDFHYHTPTGEKIAIKEDAWQKTQTLSSYSLENKIDGTYRIRGEKQGKSASFALDGKQWKAVLNSIPKVGKNQNTDVIYLGQLNKDSQLKSVKTIEVIETFVSRRLTSDHVIQHIHDGFDVQFITHPNAIKRNQPINLKLLNDQQGIAGLKVDILKQTHDFSREEKVDQTLSSTANGLLNFKIEEKGQYLLKIDYQQPFDSKSNNLKRYKYTLAFNVID